MKFSAVILAGGRSQRMGQDKAWLMLDGNTLIARQIELLRAAGAEEVFVSGRVGTDYRAVDCRILHDRIPDAGPLAGIESALSAMETPLMLVLAVDLPKMTLSMLQTLVARCRKNCGAIPRFNGQIEPLAAMYPRSSLEVATKYLATGHFAVRDFANRCVDLQLAAFWELTGEETIHFQNWNSPADIRI